MLCCAVPAERVLSRAAPAVPCSVAHASPQPALRTRLSTRHMHVSTQHATHMPPLCREALLGALWDSMCANACWPHWVHCLTLILATHFRMRFVSGVCLLPFTLFVTFIFCETLLVRPCCETVLLRPATVQMWVPAATVPAPRMRPDVTQVQAEAAGSTAEMACNTRVQTTMPHTQATVGFSRSSSRPTVHVLPRPAQAVTGRTRIAPAAWRQRWPPATGGCIVASQVDQFELVMDASSARPAPAPCPPIVFIKYLTAWRARARPILSRSLQARTPTGGTHRVVTLHMASFK